MLYQENMTNDISSMHDLMVVLFSSAKCLSTSTLRVSSGGLMLSVDASMLLVGVPLVSVISTYYSNYCCLIMAFNVFF